MFPFLIALFLIQPTNALEQWVAKKSVEISFDQISIDGGKTQSIDCKSQKKTDFASLKIGNQNLVISCQSDYLGGLSIGELLIAQREGDAGDLWDLQSILTIDSETKTARLDQLKFHVRSLLFDCEVLDESKQQPGKPKACIDKNDCRKLENSYLWDSKANKFVEQKQKAKFKVRRVLKPFPAYKNCQ